MRFYWSLGSEEGRFAKAELARLKETRNLGVDYRLWVRIVTHEKADAVALPRSAIFRDAAGQWNVFAIKSGVVRLQSVTLGLTNDDRVDITEGLADDDLVLLAPESSLIDGTRGTAVVEE